MKKDKIKQISYILSVISILFLGPAITYSAVMDNSPEQSDDSLAYNDTTRVKKGELTNEEMEKIVQERRAKNISSYEELHKNYWNPGFGKSDTAWKQQLTGKAGFSLRLGFPVSHNLYLDNSSRADSRFGFSLGLGLEHFLSEDVSYGVDLNFNYFPELFYLWGSSTSWSQLELGAHIKLMVESSNKLNPYMKFGFKMAGLRGHRIPGRGFFGGVSGTDTRSKIAYAPGAEFGIGLLIKCRKNRVTYLELTYNVLYTSGKSVKVDGETADWDYPANLKSYCIKFGGLIPFGKKK